MNKQTVRIMLCSTRTFSSRKNAQKSFSEISYISYTTAPDALYLLTISGEG